VPRVLFVNPNYVDYLADGLFHGLRTLLGADVVDFPKAEPMYASHSPERREKLRGHGFTLYGLLDDIEVDRHACLERAQQGEFDLVVFSDIWRTFGLFTEWAPQLQGIVPMAVVDGADRVEPYPYAGLWWRVRGWWFLPRALNRATYFKREITPWTWWFRSYLTLPPPVARRLGLMRGIRPIAFSIPEEKIVSELPAKTKEFGAHVVDEEVAPRVGGKTSYAFESEAAYYDDLRASRFGVTTKRAGWDCLRHYEIAANGTVPCFRDLAGKPPLCAPYGLDASNTIEYASADDLLAKTAAVSADRYAELQARALEWAHANSTVARATEFLGSLGL
jgi:hypothetical protein